MAITLLHISPDIMRAFLLISCVAAGTGFGLLTVQSSTLLQLLAPPETLGRFSGLFQSTMAGAQLISIAVTPLLVQLIISLSNYSALTSLALLILTGAIILTLYQTRKYPETVLPQSRGNISPASQLAEDQEM